MVNDSSAPVIFGDGEMVDDGRRNEGLLRVETPYISSS
jgi:hypothetical protein